MFCKEIRYIQYHKYLIDHNFRSRCPIDAPSTARRPDTDKLSEKKSYITKEVSQNLKKKHVYLCESTDLKIVNIYIRGAFVGKNDKNLRRYKIF